MQLDWTFMRLQDESDCNNPEAKLFNVRLKVDKGDAGVGAAGVDVAADDAAAEEVPEEGRADGSSGRAETAAAAAGDVSAEVARANAGGDAGVGATPPAADDGSVNAGNGSDGDEGNQAPLPPAAATPRVTIQMDPNYAPDKLPFVVEPAAVVIRGGECAKFNVKFTSDRSVIHRGYLIGRQQVDAPPRPISLKVRVWV